MVLRCAVCGRDAEYIPGGDSLVCAHCGARRSLTKEDRQAVFDYARMEKKLREFDALSMDEAAALFDSVPEFPGAREMASQCRTAAEALRERLYSAVRERAHSAGDSSAEWLGILVELENRTLDGYKDTEELRKKAEGRIAECLAAEREAGKANERRARKKTALRRALLVALPLLAVFVLALFFARDFERKPRLDYEKAVRLQENGRYEEALAAFSLLGDHADSRERAAACADAIREKEYMTACALRDGGMYEKAAAAFDRMSGYRDSADMAKACRDAVREETYRAAGRLMEEGDLPGAYALYASLNGYRDSDAILERDDMRAARLEAARRTYGSVFFGRYPQTVDGDDETAIEWTVLDLKDGKALLASRYGLECMPYNERWTNVTWEGSGMRAFLNGDFLMRAFTPQEREAIAAVTVENGKEQGIPGCDCDGGPDTRDRVFLLSYAEAWTYYRTNADRRCVVTAYAKARGAESNPETGGGWWWLRSPGSHRLYQADVFSSGACSVSRVTSTCDIVRPAMWVDLEKAGL